MIIRRIKRRRKWVLIFVPVILVAVVLVLVIVLVARGGSRPALPTQTTTVAQWNFSEGSGSRATDTTGNGHDGNIAGGTWAPGAPGQVGHFSLEFNGTNSQVAVDTASDLDVTTSIGIDVWLNLTSGVGAGDQAILTKDGAPAPYALEISPAGRIRLYWDRAWLQSRPLTWAANTWYHVTVVNDGAVTMFSRDGKSAGQVKTPGPTSIDSGQLVIGRGPTGTRDGLRGRIGYLALSVPDSRRSPAIVGTALSATTLPVGSGLTVDATVEGSWANADDSSEIDVSGQVTTPGGAVQTVPGFFYQNFTADPSTRTLVPSGTPDWQIRYSPRAPGSYTVVVSAQTSAGRTTSARYGFTVAGGSTPGYRGDVQVDPQNHNYFQYSGSKKSFFGIGADLDLPEFTKFSCSSGSPCLATHSPMRGLFGDGTNKPTGAEAPSTLYLVYNSYLTAVANLAAQGANSGRLRLDSRFLPLELSPAYTGIPGFPNGVPDFGIGRYNAANAWIADQVVALAARDGIALQLTTWNADQLSWGDSYAADDNSTLVQRRLRYEVARWGSSPGVLSWEYFNELGKTHSSMTDSFWVKQTSWLRSIDINHHLITNSYQGIDTSEHHAYTARSGSFAGLTKFLPGTLPHTTSEYGQDAFYNFPPGYDPEGVKAREGLWASLMGERSAAWYWWLDEQIVPDNLYARVFHGIAAFTAGEDPGSLTWSRAKFAPVSGPGGLHYYGMVGSDHHALVWIERATSQDLTDLLPANGNVVRIGGLTPSHRYTIEWWDPVAGRVIGRSTTTSNATGHIRLAVPNGVTRDIAAKVLPWP